MLWQPGIPMTNCSTCGSKSTSSNQARANLARGVLVVFKVHALLQVAHHVAVLTKFLSAVVFVACLMEFDVSGVSM